MAEENWWDTLFKRLFGPGAGPAVGTYGSNSPGFGGAFELGAWAGPEVARQERVANPPTPTPTPTAAQKQQANTNLREEEQVRAGLADAVTGAAKTANPLYGNLPDGKVYTGKGPPKTWGTPDTFDPRYMKPTDKTSTIQQVLEDLNTWSVKKRQRFAELAVDAGLLKEPTTQFDELEPILGSLALRSAKMYARNIKVTPWSLLERYAKAGGVPGKAGSAGPITTTTVNRSLNLSSPREANQLIDAALQQRLGRSPTEKEKKAFLEALNKAEKREPTVTKTTTTTTGSGTENVSSTSNTETSGGVNVAAFTNEWSLQHNKDEAGQYQALSTYMPAFFAALEAPV